MALVSQLLRGWFSAKLNPERRLDLVSSGLVLPPRVVGLRLTVREPNETNPTEEITCAVTVRTIIALST